MPDEPQAASTRLIYAAFDCVGRRQGVFGVGVLVAAVCAVLATGFEIVKKEERGVLVRFGRVVDAEVGPGLHYRVPFVEQLHVRKVMRIERLRVASREAGKAAFTLLSGDTNLLEVELVVQYRINNLRDYLFATVDPPKTLAMLVRQHLVDIVGKNFIDLVLTQNRDVVESYIAAQTAAHIASLQAGHAAARASGVGVEVVSLKAVDVHPIEETLAAFRDVNDAIAERIQTISQANQRKERMLARSRGQAAAVLLDAKAKARARVSQAGAAAGAFSVLLEQYRERPDQVAVTRYWRRMRTTLREAKLLAVNAEDQSSFDIHVVTDAVALPSELLAAGGQAASSAGATGQRYENADADRHLRDGGVHAPATERDHARAANLRSLLFDRPSVFAHRHVVSAADTPQPPSLGVSDGVRQRGKGGGDSRGGEDRPQASGHIEDGDQGPSIDTP